MPKYRLLNNEELHSLETEFIDFLILNGIPADDWNKMKTDQEKTDKVLELFSDVVFEKILRSITYLEHYSRSSIKTFHCDREQIFLIGVDTSDQTLDFTSSEGIHRLKTDPPSDLKVYKSSKKYHPYREMELFTMMQNGCIKSEGSLFQLLDKNL